MKKIIAILIGLSFAGAFAAETSAHSHHSHGSEHHHDGQTQKLELNNGKKWTTDRPLRESMGAILAEVKKKADKFHAGGLSKEEYQALGEKFEKEVQSIFKNCKLPAEADEALHLVLARIIEGNKKLKGEDGKQSEGFVQIVTALERYGKFFDHPGWKSVH